MQQLRASASSCRLAASIIVMLAALAPSAATGLERTITFDPVWDSVTLGIGVGGAGADYLFLKGTDAGFTPPDRAALPWVDAVTLFPYNHSISTVSVGTTGLAAAWPALFAVLGRREQVLPAAAAYTEALSFTFIAKDLLKLAFPKARPYAYGGVDLTGDLLAEADESFPSGHTAMAFCGATSFAVMAAELAPDAPATPWLIAGGYGLAAATAALRVASGDHFLVDVLAGAALGTGIGWLVTQLHIH
jgi:membrane-associated phospholipid phosphatase